MRQERLSSMLRIDKERCFQGKDKVTKQWSLLAKLVGSPRSNPANRCVVWCQQYYFLKVF
jgi:hypothetical protein